MVTKDMFPARAITHSWQFPGEDIAIPVDKEYKTNIFGLISRASVCHWTGTETTINGQFLVNTLSDVASP
jgi:hypothetical protein